MIVPVVISPAKSCLATETCIKIDGLLCCSQKGRFTWLCRSAAAYAPEPWRKFISLDPNPDRNWGRLLHLFWRNFLPKTNPLRVERKTLVTCTHSLRCASYCSYPYSTRLEVRVSSFFFLQRLHRGQKSCNKRQTHSVFSHFNAGPQLTFALNAGVTMRCRAEIVGGWACGDVTELLIVFS